MIAVSVVIITFNEEKNLERCLESVRSVADDIVVADSYSTDRTLAIAHAHGARVVQRVFEGYGQQKNFATSMAAHDWVLSLDADEALTPELAASINRLKNGPELDVYDIPRITNYCGKWIRHCGWYPDKQARFYNRTKGRWIEKKVHEYWQANDPASRKGTLQGDLLHYSFHSVSEHIRKIEKYTELAALEATDQQKNVSLLKILVAPRWRFFTDFFLRLGFLDGYYGYIICRMAEYTATIKYAKIRQYYFAGKNRPGQS